MNQLGLGWADFDHEREGVKRSGRQFTLTSSMIFIPCVFFVYFLYTVVAWRRLVAGQGRDNLASHSVSLRNALTMIVFSVEFSRRHIHV